MRNDNSGNRGTFHTRPSIERARAAGDTIALAMLQVTGDSGDLGISWELLAANSTLHERDFCGVMFQPSASKTCGPRTTSSAAPPTPSARQQSDSSQLHKTQLTSYFVAGEREGERGEEGRVRGAVERRLHNFYGRRRSPRS